LNWKKRVGVELMTSLGCGENNTKYVKGFLRQ
jgi:hypothetical protein